MAHKYSSDFLKARQGMPLELKIKLSQSRIKQFYDNFLGNVYISFSGGKDSTVLLDLVRKIYPNVIAVFVDTGLEYPEIKDFVRTIDNVEWLKPKMPFHKVVEKYGYPVISKEQAQFIQQFRVAKSKKTRDTRWNGNKYGRGKISEKWKFLLNTDIKISEECCNVMKKNPSKQYEKQTNRKPYVGTMTGESALRVQKYLRESCNAFDNKRPTSTPLAFWKEDDVWAYIKTNSLPYSKIYDMGFERTGCMFCMFGVHLEKGENRFQKMAKTHPKQYDYCINKLGCGKVLDTIGVNYKIQKGLFSMAKITKNSGGVV